MESEVGKGTSFYIDFPAIDEINEMAERKVPAEIPTGSERILVVDDEGVIVGLHKALLQKLGYKVIPARQTVLPPWRNFNLLRKILIL